MKTFTEDGRGEAAAYLQEVWRSHRARAVASAKIQAAFRGKAVRRDMRRLRAAAVIQRAFRRSTMRHSLHRLGVFSVATEVGARAATVHAWPSVSLIQRHFRAHRLRCRWRAMMETLSTRYLTDEHDRAEARKGDSWYSPAMLIRRERLWRDADVQRALQGAWDSFSQATARHHGERAAAHGGRPAHGGGAHAEADGVRDASVLTWPDYFEIRCAHAYAALREHRRAARCAAARRARSIAHPTYDPPVRAVRARRRGSANSRAGAGQHRDTSHEPLTAAVTRRRPRARWRTTAAGCTWC